MRGFGIVELQVLAKPCLNILVSAKVNVLAFHCSPQSLNEHVVERSAFTIHTDLDTVPLRVVLKMPTRKLLSLIDSSLSAIVSAQRSLWQTGCRDGPLTGRACKGLETGRGAKGPGGTVLNSDI